MKELIEYQIAPWLLIIFLTPATQYLVFIGNPEATFGLDFAFGNLFSWSFVVTLIIWGLVWLRVPSKKFVGPESSNKSVKPTVYQANGELYYISTILSYFFLTLLLDPSLSFHVKVYQNMSPILGTLNIVAFFISAFLLSAAKSMPQKQKTITKDPLIYQFYHGLLLSPKIFGVDVKQLTNCRIGMMLWQLLLLSFFIAGWKLRGFSNSHFDNLLLQSFYIYMFFRWETGYFNTLDFTMDKTGWMLVWGCVVWIPSLYTFSSFFLVGNNVDLGLVTEGLMFLLGVGAIWFHSEADRQKEQFKLGDKNLQIWGKPAKTLEITYKDAHGKQRKSRLLISGWWGIGRKMNYFLDILATFSWCWFAGTKNGLWPYACFIFVTILLIHRVFRDEAKCKAKYGNGWDQYCKVVKYRMVPYIF